jgi:glucosamine--fructose-6-phosphate aminotransferase (isomerizing)
MQAERGGYKHFMLKEIHEQPRAIEDTLRGRVSMESGAARAAEMGITAEHARAVKRVVFLACGTSYHAALHGRYLLEALARVPAVAELASEFRYRDPVVGEGDLVVAVSQSGETADTLAAAKEAKERGARVLAVVNVQGSAIARMAHGTLYTHAGPEIGVASTKCFTAQLAALTMLASTSGAAAGRCPPTGPRAARGVRAGAPQDARPRSRGRSTWSPWRGRSSTRATRSSSGGGSRAPSRWRARSSSRRSRTCTPRATRAAR